MERKNWRIYFNSRHVSRQEMWSVDEGTQETERHVGWFELVDVRAGSMVKPDAPHGAPSGWISAAGCFAEFKHGGVLFTNQETD